MLCNTENLLSCSPSSSSAVPQFPATDSEFPPAQGSSMDMPDTHSSRTPYGRGEDERIVHEYPLAQSTSLIQVIRDNEDHIDIEEEEAAYRAFDLDDSDNSALDLSTRNSRPKATSSNHFLFCHEKSRPRPPSSIFSHDIWVGENGDAEKDDSFAKGVRIVGWTSVGDKRGGAYVVYDCAILTPSGTTIHVHKRYSAFLSLHMTLTSTSSPSALPKHIRKDVPPLPPRTALAKFRPGFLEGRRKALQAWLSTVLLHPEIGGCRAVREWVMEG